MEEKRISVIVPVYNAEKYLDICITSLVKQSYANFELILVNDGSTDDSLKICQAWSNRDRRIKVYDRENGGAAAARNTGLDHAQGEYIVFADSDDSVSPQYLENLYKAAESGGYDIVQCHMLPTQKQVFDAPEVSFLPEHVKEITKTEALNGRLFKVSFQAKIYASGILKDFRIKEGDIYEDDASYYILIYKSKKIALLAEPLYFYYLSENSVMRNNRSLDFAFVNIYEERKKFFLERNEDLLYKGTVSRFCIVLLLAYARRSRHEVEDKKKLFRLYCSNYSLIKHSSEIVFKEKLMFLLFRISPNISSWFIRKIRK